MLGDPQEQAALADAMHFIAGNAMLASIVTVEIASIRRRVPSFSLVGGTAVTRGAGRLAHAVGRGANGRHHDPHQPAAVLAVARCRYPSGSQRQGCCPPFAHQRAARQAYTRTISSSAGPASELFDVRRKLAL